MKQIPVAVQLYSVRHECEKDLAGTLAKIKAMGYVGVEFAGWYGHTAATLKTLLDDHGLKCAGAHVGIQTLLGDELEASVEFHKILDNKFLIVPGLSRERTESLGAWQKTADAFNGIADQLAPYDMRTGYHNHHTEFTPFTPGGALPWDVFFGNTVKEVVMQFDTGNALHGGKAGRRAELPDALSGPRADHPSKRLRRGKRLVRTARRRGRRPFRGYFRGLRERRRHSVVHRRV